MSGGSFNYASDATDLEDLLNKRFDLDQLRDRLYSHHDGIEMDDVAADLDSLLAYVAQVNRRVVARLKRLQPVMHAVEWRDSADWGPDRVRDAVAKYRGLDEPPAYATTRDPSPTTIEPLLSMLDDMQAMHHMRIAHAHDYVLGPTNSREGLERTHAELHEKHQGLSHEHRRH